MSESFIGLRLFAVVLIIAANGFFAGAEVSLVSVRASRLRQMAEEGRAGAQAALSLLANPERLLSVTQVGVTIASLGLGWAGEETVYQVLVSALGPVLPAALHSWLHGLSFVLAFALISYLHILAGEVLPKNLAIENADRLAVIVAPALLVFYRLTTPFVYVVEKSSQILSRALKVSAGHGGGHSPEELKFIVSSSRGLGYLPERQEDMIHRVLDLNNVYVREIMVPRNGIVSIPIDANLDEVLKTMVEHQHSRLPVYEKKPEQIVGVLHYKDLLAIWEERRAAIRAGRPQRTFRVRPVMRKHLVVPETKPLLQMLEDFQDGRSHMAMVVNEFGTIVGLVTVEDVLEQVVGSISDEHDERAAAAGEATLLELDGATKIRDLDKDYGIELPGGNYETVAGFLLARLGAIPKPGDAVEWADRRFTVVEMDRNRIARVRMEKVSGPSGG